VRVVLSFLYWSFRRLLELLVLRGRSGREKEIVSLANLDTGKTIVKNISGPETFTLNPDNSRIVDGQGANLVIFGCEPASEQGASAQAFSHRRTIAG
jgi:hypothetical protein